MPYLKNITFAFLILNGVTAQLTAQPLAPKDYGLKAYSIQDPSLGLIRLYVNTENIGKKEPLFIEVNGSGGLPFCKNEFDL